MSSTRVSVVVTHFEQPRQLARMLAALDAQTRPADEVVVADDGSHEPPAVPAGVRLVRQPDRGFRAAAARNLGAARATGDVLVFLDADTAPEPECLAHLTRLPATWPESVVVGRRRHVDLADGTELEEPTWLRDGYARTRDLADADETSFRFVISAVLACSRWLFDLVGGFDESFTAYGGEDWEWAHRAWTHGAVLAHEPRAVAWHDGPESPPGDRDRQLAETLAIARRIPVPGVAPTGLLVGPADPVVTVARDLSPDGLVLTADSLLAALPRARLLLHAEHAALLEGDPRVHPLGEAAPGAHPAARSAWRRLHVHAAATGPTTAWTDPGDLLRGPGAPARVSVVDDHPVVTWRSLRAERRAARSSRDDPADRSDSETDSGARVTSTLTRLHPDLTVAARWGGWA